MYIKPNQSIWARIFLSQSNAMTRLIKQYELGKFKFVPGDGHGVEIMSTSKDVVQAILQAISYGQKGENYLIGAYNLLIESSSMLLAKRSAKHKLYNFPIELFCCLEC